MSAVKDMAMVPAKRRVTFRCDSHGCANALTVPVADLDKLPKTWTCPICLDEQRDQYVNATAQATATAQETTR